MTRSPFLTRRALLQRAVMAGTLSGKMSGFATQAAAQTDAKTPSVPNPIRGVNLGGWLVLERWLTPSLFADSSAQDEYSFSAGSDAKRRARLATHRETFITDADFKWIAAHGLNAVRIPVGYWTLEANPPYVTTEKILDRAFDSAQKHGLKVLLDLHGAPGSQNGWDHSGRAGTLGWHTSPENIAHTYRVLDSLAERYGTRSNLLGIELLNEPRWDVPQEILKDFYQQAYKRLRKHLNPERTAIVFHDGCRPFNWQNFMTAPEYTNVALDTHMYQCYTDEDKKRDAWQHIQRAAIDRKRELGEMQRTIRAMVGEWSLALNPDSLRGLTPTQTDFAKRGYGAAQLLSYETTAGWFFWTYKTENIPEWSYRTSVERGWLPARFDTA